MKPMFFLLPVLLLAPTIVQAQAARDSVETKLALHHAMDQAQVHLLENCPKKAVEVLEDQLTKVGGNPSYLAKLREAYRSYITHLWLANQADLAQRYLERLCIIEPTAAGDPMLRPPSDKEKRTLALPEPPSPDAKTPPLPRYLAATPPSAATTPPVENVDRGPKPSTVRAHADENVDPFDPAFRRPDPERDGRLKMAQMLLGRADDQFSQRKYPDAKLLYDQAFAADRSVLSGSKDRYAYCLLDQVKDEINRGLSPERRTTLQKTVVDAVGLSPRLEETGKWMLRVIDSRSKDMLLAASPDPRLSIQHVGQNKEGWNVTETAHFRIFHHQGAEFAEKVAQIAERTRLEMYRKWFGNDGIDWTPKCELILHATGADYQRMTGVPATSPGHSRIESDPSGKRVVARRMDLRIDHPGMIEAVLPHETTHVVLAGMFDGHVVPRWADEGIAVLTEPEDKVQQHRRNLAQTAALRQLFSVKELMTLSDYPEPRRIAAFYAQSVGVVDFLSRQKGPTVLTQFIRDGLRDGYDASLQKHYGFDFTALEQQWREYVAAAGALAAR